MRKATNYRNTFLTKSRITHGDKYDYSCIPSVFRYDTFVNIVCTVHGVFSQKACAHATMKSGCPLCANDSRTTNVYNKKRHSLEQFIEKARRVHGKYYDYSLTQYVAQMKDLTVVCPKHGPFVVCANNHIHGTGCNKCRRSRGETLINEYLLNRHIHYEVQRGFEDLRSPDVSERAFNHPKYDFYVPSHNLLIEFDGKHHFEPVQFRGVSKEEATKLHTRTIYTDDIKNKYAHQHGYILLRIPYYDLKQIDSILDRALCSSIPEI